MKFRSISNWQEPSELSGLLFFAQRVDEMTFSYTIDSYKTPTTSIPTLLTECLETIENYEKIGKDHRASLHILDELSLRLRGNKAVANCITLKLDTHLAINRQNVEDVKSKLKVLKRELSAAAYLSALTPLLKTAVIENRKILIDSYARELVATLQGIGLSTEFINQRVRSHFFGNSKIKSANDLDNFVKKISPMLGEYTVYVYVNDVFKDLSSRLLENFKVKIIDEIPSEFTKLAWVKELPACPNDSVLVQVTEIPCSDEYTALEKSLERITVLYDLLGVFHHKTVSSLGDFALVSERASQSRLKKLSTNSNKMHFITDNKPQTAAKEMEETIVNVRLLGGSDHAKFMRVVDFHGMALRAAAPENQLLNLWTALETIVPTSTKASIVDGVMEGALPFIGLNYLSRLANSITFDLLRWNKGVVTKILDSAYIPADFDIVEKIFCIAACEEYRDARDELFDRLGNFELLRNRVYSIGATFETSKKAKDKLELHQRLVEWQFHRIYRTRNAIVHSNRVPHFTPSLVISAHDYFDQVFKITTDLCSGLSGFTTFEEAFSYSKDAFKEYLGFFDEYEKLSTEQVTKLIWTPRPKLTSVNLLEGLPQA